MSRNPFVQTKDQSTEFGFGAGHFPNPQIDYSAGGQKSRFPIADPDATQQLLDLAAAKRTDLNSTAESTLPAFNGTSNILHPMHIAEGNTERYGAQPPLVIERKAPPNPPKPKFVPHRMQRSS